MSRVLLAVALLWASIPLDRLSPEAASPSRAGVMVDEHEVKIAELANRVAALEAQVKTLNGLVVGLVQASSVGHTERNSP